MHAPRISDPVRRLTLGAVLITLALGVLAPNVAPRADALGWSPYVDEPSRYDGQYTCTSAPRPGTVALSRWLLATYRATRSMGTMRACGTGGQSEHKDGRAFDWGADVAKPATRRAAFDFIRRLLATDAAGNEHALARRMGIMYFIYNDTMWSSYRGFAPRPYLSSGCRTRAKCSRTLRHLNHVHISLGYAGAAAQTSWFRSRGVASQPVFYPGSRDLDPDLTAVTGFTAPVTGALAGSPFYLRPGVTYRIVVTGTETDAGGTSDAVCGVDGLPILGALGLVLVGGPLWETECRPDHTYETWFTPLVRQRLQVRYLGLGAGRTGSFSVYVARDDITLGSLVRK